MLHREPEIKKPAATENTEITEGRIE